MSRLQESDSVLLGIEGDWWQIAGNPDLGGYGTGQQQPMDFAIWQAEDGTWQLWSCVRRTGCGGRGRLFFGWQGRNLFDTNWQPRGIVMEADPRLGETKGGLQSPFVYFHNNKQYYLYYGDWKHICMAQSRDGKHFERIIRENGITGMFSEGEEASARDPMIVQHEKMFFLYYTGVHKGRGSIYCRKSADLLNWGDSVVVSSGGSAGSGHTDAESAFVIHRQDEKSFYLFRSHSEKSASKFMTTVYRSPDPLDFGIDSDERKVALLKMEAVRVIVFNGDCYLASLNPDYTGIRMAKLKAGIRFAN
ncbi:MAG TPA: hypothetical protein VMZ49_10725 [Patescibacteria group bacterium]|nr:hypothetical protein [Patescibacteria group bacterium]